MSIPFRASRSHLMTQLCAHDPLPGGLASTPAAGRVLGFARLWGPAASQEMGVEWNKPILPLC